MNAFQKCFAGDNQIAMADGQTKPIIDAKIGDYVKAIDSFGHLVDTQIVSILHKNTNSTSKLSSSCPLFTSAFDYYASLNY